MTEPSTPQQEALEAFLFFRSADMELWRRAGVALDLTSPAMMALAVILRSHAQGEPARQIDLSAALSLSPAGVSQIVDALVERQLVRREPAPADRRAVMLAPAHAGTETGDEVDAEAAAFHALVAGLSPEALEGFTTVMHGMRAYIDGQFRPPA